MQAQTRTIAGAGPRLATATRSQSGDPARAGALRLSVLAAVVALAAGGATLVATRKVLLDGSLTQLETVRAAVQADVAHFTHGLADGNFSWAQVLCGDAIGVCEKLGDLPTRTLLLGMGPRTLGELRRRYDSALSATLLCELDKEMTGRGAQDILDALRSK